MSPSEPRRLFSSAVLLLFGAVAVWSSGCRGSEAPAPAPVPAAEQSAAAAPPAPSRAIVRLHPATAKLGEAFNRQPNGSSAISVVGAGFVRGDKVYWGGQVLKTVFGGETTLTVEVPPGLVSQPGDVAISVKNPDDPQSTEVRATFRVLGRSGH